MEHKKSSLTLKKVSDVFTYTIHKSQRALNKQHLQKIINDQVKEFERYQSFSILQAFSVAQIVNDKTYIIDVRHLGNLKRWVMMSKM